MWGRIINAQSKTITSAAIVIGFMSLVSRFLGVFRDRILASQFGVGDSLDIYYAAFRLPDLIFNLIILGAISAGLIPIFSEFIAKDRKEDAWRLISNVLNILTLVLVGCSVVLYFFMPTLMQWLTPGFGSDKIAQVVGLSRIMLISNVFLGISTIFGTILQSFRRFFVYSLAPIFYNVGIILGALYLAPSLGVIGLAWGVVLGAFFHMMIQIAPTFSVGFNYRFIFQWADVAVKEVWTLMIPRTLTLVVNQLNTVIITVVASTMSAGAITIYNLSNNLQSLPLGLFGISFAVAALPTLSLLAAEKKHNEFVSTISATMRQIIFLIVPISIWLYVLRAQVVRVILGAGNFTWQDTRLTAAALALFALSLFAQSIIPLIIRAFYALKNTT
ncbi:MAG: murein biosynthesis integral membrane protein MurJ, partial [bacterium]